MPKTLRPRKRYVMLVDLVFYRADLPLICQPIDYVAPAEGNKKIPYRTSGIHASSGLHTDDSARNTRIVFNRNS